MSIQTVGHWKVTWVGDIVTLAGCALCDALLINPKGITPSDLHAHDESKHPEYIVRQCNAIVKLLEGA